MFEGLSVTSSTKLDSQSRSGDAMQSSGTDHSGFSVNFGNGVVQGASPVMGVPSWVWLAAVSVGMAILWKRYT